VGPRFLAHSVTYPVNRTTTLTNYHRGIPQNIAYPGASESAVVNDRGEITSHTDATGATTEYEYDVMGRLQCISYPDGDPCDPNGATPTGWFPTLISFEEAAGTQPYNLPDGTWKRTVRTGNTANGYAVSETWYDGLWRPIYTREYDSGDQPNTTRVTRRRFDYAGREAFVSFPTNDGKDYNNYGFGIYNWFDGIGRPLRTRTDSELGALIRTYEYRPGFVTRVTNERNHYTDFSYLAYDSPSTDWPIQIDAPGTDGTSPRIVTTIERDVYGKPKTIARGQVQRLFVYDAHQRLCRSFDPEALWTVQTYDEASNIDWRAIGQAMTNAPANQCAVHLADPKQRSVYTFDARNRLEHINHPDGTHDLHFDYYPDGALAGTIVYNDAGTPLTSWSYNYNERRMLETETLSVAGRNYLLQHNYDRYGSRSQLIYPDGTQLSYAPNRLGQPKAVGALANTVKYQPSGAVKSFNYGNSVSYLATPNARQLPFTVQISNGILNEEYTWDQVGNLLGVSDNRSPLISANRTRSFAYDHANRLINATYAEPGLGPYGFEYDIQDNITRATRPIALGGNRNYEYSGSTRRLDRLYNDSGQTQIAYLYDAQGNATLRDPSGLSMDAYAYHYDRANRLIEVRDPLDQTKVEASYLYDGHARRVLITEEGEQRVQVYSQAGQYLFEEPDLITDASFTTGESEQGKPSTRYQYLGNMLIAKSSGTQTTYLHTDHLGSPIAESSVGPTVEVTHLPLHEPYGAPSNGTYLDGPGYTGHVVDGLTGLSYMQARYYDPVAGRFLGVDPVGVDLGSGGNFNRYWYGNNDPYGFVDPDGRFAGKVVKFVVKGGDLAATFAGAVEDYNTLSDPNSTFGERAVAGISLASEILPVSIGDAKDVVNGIRGAERASDNGKGDYVYRGLGKGEDPSNGLSARSPDAGNSELSHVSGKRDSQWISTSKDPGVATGKYGEHGAVRIDLNKVNSEVSDVSGGFPGAPRQSNYARRDQEVLIKGKVPSEAIERIK
jgi:RHS repeat-associated protein